MIRFTQEVVPLHVNISFPNHIIQLHVKCPNKFGNAEIHLSPRKATPYEVSKFWIECSHQNKFKIQRPSTSEQGEERGAVILLHAQAVPVAAMERVEVAHVPGVVWIAHQPTFGVEYSWIGKGVRVHHQVCRCHAHGRLQDTSIHQHQHQYQHATFPTPFHCAKSDCQLTFGGMAHLP